MMVWLEPKYRIFPLLTRSATATATGREKVAEILYSILFWVARYFFDTFLARYLCSVYTNPTFQQKYTIVHAGTVTKLL